MRLITVVLILSLISMSAAMMTTSMKGKRKGGGRVDGRRRCQRLPRPMSLQRFRDEVEGDGYHNLLNTQNFEIDLSTAPLHGNIAFYDTDTQGEFRADLTARFPGDTGSGVCPFVASVFLTEKSEDFAWFDIPVLDFEAYYFTRNASNYLIEILCNETRGDNPGRQCCTGIWIVTIYANHDPPHFFDWKGVSRDLWRQLRLCLNDEYGFTYQLNACANAVP